MICSHNLPLKKRLSASLEQFGSSGEIPLSKQSQTITSLVQNREMQFTRYSGNQTTGFLNWDSLFVPQEGIDDLMIEIETTRKVLCKLETLEYRNKYSKEALYKTKVEYTNRFRYLLGLKEAYSSTK